MVSHSITVSSRVRLRLDWSFSGRKLWSTFLFFSEAVFISRILPLKLKYVKKRLLESDTKKKFELYNSGYYIWFTLCYINRQCLWYSTVLCKMYVFNKSCFMYILRKSSISSDNYNWYKMLQRHWAPMIFIAHISTLKRGI